MEFGLSRYSGILIFVDSATRKNRPSATFVPSKIPKVAPALRFCGVFIFPLFTQTQVPTQSIIMRIQPCQNFQGFHFWIVSFECERSVGAENVGMGSSSCFITWQTSDICKWSSRHLVHFLVLWGQWYNPMWVISLIIRGVNAFAWGCRSWVIHQWTYFVISHNCEGIWNLTRSTLYRLTIQPSACQIDIFGCGHFSRVFNDILPIWWEHSSFHVRHGRSIIVKYHIELGTYSTCGGVPH